MSNKYNVTDLITSALEQKPLEFENAFSDIVRDRIAGKIEDRKIEVSKNMFNPPAETETEVETELETEE